MKALDMHLHLFPPNEFFCVALKANYEYYSLRYIIMSMSKMHVGFVMVKSKHIETHGQEIPSIDNNEYELFLSFCFKKHLHMI